MDKKDQMAIDGKDPFQDADSFKKTTDTENQVVNKTDMANPTSEITELNIVSPESNSDSSRDTNAEDAGREVDFKADIFDDLDEDDDFDDDLGIEDEFGSIPDSFSDDFSNDDNSITSLLYDDDEATNDHDTHDGGMISFSDLRQQMQKLKDDAMELRPKEDAEAEVESVSDIPEDVLENQVTDDVTYITDEAQNADIQEVADNSPEETLEEKESVKNDYLTDVDEDTAEVKEESLDAKEHVITINRSRIKETSRKENKIIDFAFNIAEAIVFVLLALILVLTFLLRHTAVSGTSMLNTLYDGDRLIISNLFYQPKTGDIIIFDGKNSGYDEKDTAKILVKRVIAVEGDTVEIIDGVVFVNGNALDESEYVLWDLEGEINGSRYYPTIDDMDLITVPEGEIFVLGDNRGNSKDSRTVGTINVDAIIGKVLFRFYSSEKESPVLEFVK